MTAQQMLISSDSISLFPHIAALFHVESAFITQLIAVLVGVLFQNCIAANAGQLMTRLVKVISHKPRIAARFHVEFAFITQPIAVLILMRTALGFVIIRAVVALRIVVRFGFMKNIPCKAMHKTSAADIAAVIVIPILMRTAQSFIIVAAAVALRIVVGLGYF